MTAVFVSQIPKIQLDTSTEGFLHDDDPALQAYNVFRDQFGRDEVISRMKNGMDAIGKQ